MCNSNNRTGLSFQVISLISNADHYHLHHHFFNRSLAFTSENVKGELLKSSIINEKG